MKGIYFTLTVIAMGSLLTMSSCNQGNRVSEELKGQLKGKAEKHLRDSEQWGKVIMKELDQDKSVISILESETIE